MQFKGRPPLNTFSGSHKLSCVLIGWSMKVRDLTRPAHYVNTDDSVKVAAQVLAEKNVNALFVRAKGEVVGILTVRDLLKFAARCDTMAQAKVKSIMSQPVLSIEEGENVMQAGKLMEQHDIRHLG